MSRVTVLSILLAVLVSVVLFKVKYDVIALEERLERLNRDILADREAIHVLDAEWAHLNAPDRLRRLVEEYLDLVPLGAEQVVSVADLPRRGGESAVAAVPAHPAAEEGQ